MMAESEHSNTSSSLSDAEKEEIEFCARQYIRMLLIDDRNIPLATMMETQFDELCAYYQLAETLNGYGICGVEKPFADLQSDPLAYYHQQKRPTYLKFMQDEITLEFLNDLKKGRISSMPKLLRLPTSKQEFLIFPERYKLENQTDSIVCWPGEAVPVMEPMPYSLTNNPYTDSKRSGKPFTFPGAEHLTVHHIISHRLLNTFYDIHAQMDAQLLEASPYDHIERRFLNIIEHSKRKLHAVQTWKFITGGNPFEYRGSSLPADFPQTARMDKDEQFLSIIRRQNLWSLGANLLIGPFPEERGPFDPSIRNLDFEFDSEIILGQPRYKQYLELYQLIKKFVELQPHERTMDEAAHIYFLIDLIQGMGDIIPYNPEHWEKRVATEEELQGLKKQHQRKYRNKEFMAIKKIQKPQVQSVDDLADELSEVLH